jgi:manganese efflux pump family protein
MLKLLLFVIPLGLDSFAVAAALGLRGPTGRERVKISLLISGFETAMPVVGLLIGRGLGSAIGGAAGYVAIGLLAVLGAWMLLGGDEREEERVRSLGDGNLPAAIALGLSISLDELAVGLTIGLLGLPIWTAVVLIGAQAFLLAQLGLGLGARLGERLGDRAERLAGVTLLGLAIVFAVEKL